MVDGVGLRARQLHLLEKNLVVGGDALDLGFGAGQREHSRVERRRVFAQHGWRVALRIERNEDRLHLAGRGAEIAQRLANDREVGRADVGAAGEAEVKQHQSAAKIF